MKNSAKRFLVFLAVVAFGLNWVWEMAQMFAYAEKPAASAAGTFLFCMGAACAVLFEWFALHLGLWSYGEQLIVVPFIGIGLLPFVQLTLLVPLAIWLAKKFKGVYLQKN